MKREVRSRLTLAIFTATLLLDQPQVRAQLIPGSPGPPPQRPTRVETRTLSTIEAENYDPRGVRVGSFLLFPSLEADVAYNDNVFALPASQGPVGSFLEIIRPSVTLRSDWGRHMLSAFARGNIGFYNAAPIQNFADFGIGVDGRLDVERTGALYGGLQFNRLHEDPGLPNTVQAPVGATLYNQMTGSVGYFHKITRLSGRMEFRADRFSYLDNGLGVAQGVIPNFDRDRTELRESLRIGYEFIDGYEIWVRGMLNQRLYVNPVDVTGFARNSSGWDAVAGVSLDLGGVTTAELFAGYLQQIYVDPRFQPLQGPQFGAAITWNPLENLRVKPYAIRTINEATYVANSGYLNTSMGFSVNYDPLPNVRLDGRADYTIADYQSTSTTARYDQYYAFGAGITYLPVPQFFIGTRYQFIHLSSNQSAFDYSQNVIMLRFGARL